MKHIKIILISIAVALLLVACSNLIGSSKTSLVTITIGSDKVASIDIQRATVWAKLKNFLAENVHVSTALAAVPTNVLSLGVAVTASDMPTISQVVNNVGGLSSISIVIEVPNGLGREFVVTGLDSVSNIAYWGGTTIDLSGNPVLLSLQMINLGSVTTIVYVSTSGTDTTGYGTQQNPFRTISYALGSLNNNFAIFVGPGTYDSALETFPLQLKPATALICRGANYSTVIDAFSGPVADAIYGNAGTHIDGCKIIPYCDNTGIDDRVGGTAPAVTMINNVFIDEGSVGCGALNNIILSANSGVTNSTILNSTWHGIDVISGNPVIRNNTVSGHSEAILVESGNPAISSNSIINNPLGTGISITGGIPVIQSNDIQTNTTGISIANVSPTVTNNTVHGNTTGIIVSGSTAMPLISNNSIYCNTGSDLAASGTTALIATFNSWDHDPLTTPPGPTTLVAGCGGGVDICLGGTVTFNPPNTAVPGGCL